MGVGSSILGSGAYKIRNLGNIKTNSLFKKGAVSMPAFQNGARYVEITHREFLCDLYAGPLSESGVGGTAFAAQVFNINPGLKSNLVAGSTTGAAVPAATSVSPGGPVFPASVTLPTSDWTVASQQNGCFNWLAALSQQFETYEIHGLAFEFKSTSGELSTASTALGSVIFAADYNALSAPFLNKATMENYDGAVSCKPSEHCVFGMECSQSQLPNTHRYIRTNGMDIKGDQRLYDLGEVTVATVGCPTAGAVLGELWVTYHVRLYQPQLTVVSSIPPVPPVSSDGLWAYSQIKSVIDSPAPSIPPAPDYSFYMVDHCTTAVRSMFYGDTNYGWAVGEYSNDEQDDSQLRIELAPDGFPIVADGDNSPDCIWRLCGSAVTGGRVVELQLVWGSGETFTGGAQARSPALAKEFTAPVALLRSSYTLNITYPAPSTALYPYGFVSLWVFEIDPALILEDEVSGEPYLPIVFHDSTFAPQKYSAKGYWTSYFSLAANMYSSDGSAAGPLSFPYNGVSLIDSS
jgi:hypothetical protein